MAVAVAHKGAFIDRSSGGPKPLKLPEDDRAYTWRAKLEQAVKLAVNLNSQLEEKKPESPADKKSDRPVPRLDLSAKNRNLRDLNTLLEHKKPVGIIHNGYIVRNGLSNCRHIAQSRVLELMKLVEKADVSEEVFRLEFEKFKEFLIECLADINEQKTELSQLVMPDKIGGSQEPLCPELKNVLEVARKVVKVRVCITQKERGPLDFRQTLKFDHEVIDDVLSKWIIKVSVIFMTAHSNNLAKTPDPELPDIKIPDRINIRHLWGKRHGETIKGIFEGNQNIVSLRFEEFKDSTDLKSLMSQLVEPMVIELLKRVETYNPNTTVSDPNAFTQQILHTIESACGIDVIRSCERDLRARKEEVLRLREVGKTLRTGSSIPPSLPSTQLSELDKKRGHSGGSPQNGRRRHSINLGNTGDAIPAALHEPAAKESPH